MTTLDKINDETRDWDWIGHAAAGAQGADGQWVIDHRAELEVVGGVSDVEACYSYYDYALVRLGDIYALVETSGCSCPSPSETWCVTKGPCYLEEIIAWFNENLSKEGSYSVIGRQKEEFFALFEKALTQ